MQWPSQSHWISNEMGSEGFPNSGISNKSWKANVVRGWGIPRGFPSNATPFVHRPIWWVQRGESFSPALLIITIVQVVYKSFKTSIKNNKVNYKKTVDYSVAHAYEYKYRLRGAVNSFALIIMHNTPGVSGFWCHRLERPALPRRICAVTRGFQTTTQDLSVFPFLRRHYHMTRVLLLPFITAVWTSCGPYNS